MSIWSALPFLALIFALPAALIYEKGEREKEEARQRAIRRANPLLRMQDTIKELQAAFDAAVLKMEKYANTFKSMDFQGRNH